MGLLIAFIAGGIVGFLIGFVFAVICIEANQRRIERQHTAEFKTRWEEFLAESARHN